MRSSRIGETIIDHLDFTFKQIVEMGEWHDLRIHQESYESLLQLAVMDLIELAPVKGRPKRKVPGGAHPSSQVALL